MRKYITILAFFLLMEYQVLYGNGDYSPITAFGLIVICLYYVHLAGKGFRIKDSKLKLPKFPKKKTSFKAIIKTPYIIIGLYILGLAVPVIVLDDFGYQFIAALVVIVLGLVSLSIYEIYHSKKNTVHEKKIKDHLEKPNKMSSFGIPVLYLLLINFLLSVQLDKNIAYQFILILSGLILYDLFTKEDYYTDLYERKKISAHELQHYLFHRWSKYLNFFLAEWYFISLESNGIIDSNQKLILLFIFSVIFLTFIFRMTARFTIRDFIGIVMLAAFITSLDPLAEIVINRHLPHYIQAMMLFLMFDIGDIYYHSKRFEDVNASVWMQKTLMYALLTIFIVQLHLMESNPNMDLDSIFSSAIDGAEDRAVKVIQVEDVENASAVRRSP